MDINKNLLLSELENCKEVFLNSKFPLWDELPKLELYMDQVVVLLNDYLGYISRINPDEKSVTSSMINNYVKMKIIPAPNKKKYSRIHLSRLIIICSLKKSLNISTVYKLLPDSEEEQKNKEVYDAFVKSRNKSIDDNVIYLEREFSSALNSEKVSDVFDMISRVAAAADLQKMFAEKFTNLVFTKEEPEEKKQDKEKSDKKDKEKPEKNDKKQK